MQSIDHHESYEHGADGIKQGMLVRYATLEPIPTYSMTDMPDKYLHMYTQTWAKNDMYCTIDDKSVRFVALPLPTIPDDR